MLVALLFGYVLSQTESKCNKEAEPMILPTESVRVALTAFLEYILVSYPLDDDDKEGLDMLFSMTDVNHVSQVPHYGVVVYNTVSDLLYSKLIELMKIPRNVTTLFNLIPRIILLRFECLYIREFSALASQDVCAVFSMLIRVIDVSMLYIYEGCPSPNELSPLSYINNQTILKDNAIDLQMVKEGGKIDETVCKLVTTIAVNFFLTLNLYAKSSIFKVILNLNYDHIHGDNNLTERKVDLAWGGVKNQRDITRPVTAHFLPELLHTNTYLSRHLMQLQAERPRDFFVSLEICFYSLYTHYCRLQQASEKNEEPEESQSTNKRTKSKGKKKNKVKKKAQPKPRKNKKDLSLIDKLQNLVTSFSFNCMGITYSPYKWGTEKLTADHLSLLVTTIEAISCPNKLVYLREFGSVANPIPSITERIVTSKNIILVFFNSNEMFVNSVMRGLLSPCLKVSVDFSDKIVNLPRFLANMNDLQDHNIEIDILGLGMYLNQEDQDPKKVLANLKSLFSHKLVNNPTIPFPRPPVSLTGMAQLLVYGNAEYCESAATLEKFPVGDVPGTYFQRYLWTNTPLAVRHFHYKNYQRVLQNLNTIDTLCIDYPKVPMVIFPCCIDIRFECFSDDKLFEVIRVFLTIVLRIRYRPCCIRMFKIRARDSILKEFLVFVQTCGFVASKASFPSISNMQLILMVEWVVPDSNTFYKWTFIHPLQNTEIAPVNSDPTPSTKPQSDSATSESIPLGPEETSSLNNPVVVGATPSNTAEDVGPQSNTNTTPPQ
ncbi:hypothetical protein NEHOM01_1809 [Nematocida homosporus]|uniref:uncharacterized protein n=1 Tax=Nematocida homosporus TaxID=1912981 RepID=UPI00221FAA32|nr:uncharacterized protein NEHOM01_1809 [Nematocida homosporus]KAI5186943.1 hypothetical protein NEHOM01_1809 [Nematocida homosporus]